MCKDNIDKVLEEMLLEEEVVPESVIRKKEEAFRMLKDIESEVSTAEYIISKNSSNKSTNKKVFKYIAASIAILLFPIINTATSKEEYKYISSENRIISSDGPVYILEESIKVNEDIEIKSFSANLADNHVRIEAQSTGDTVLEKARLTIEGKEVELKSNLFEYENNTELVSSYNGKLDINENSDVKYTIYLKDGEKITEDIKLEEVKGVEDYSELGDTVLNADVPITAITTEDSEKLILDLYSMVNDKEFNIFVGGHQDRIAGVKIIDNSGHTTVGKWDKDISGNVGRTNSVEFDTRGLERPYKIELTSVELEPEYSKPILSSELSIPLPKNGEKTKINKEIMLDANKEYGIGHSDSITIESIKRNDMECTIRFTTKNIEGNGLELTSISAYTPEYKDTEEYYDYVNLIEKSSDQNIYELNLKLKDYNQEEMSITFRGERYKLSEKLEYVVE